MSKRNLRTGVVVLAVLALVTASLACNEQRRELPPTPYVPPTAIPSSDPPPTVTPVPPTAESGPAPTEASGPNLVITSVTLSTNTPPVDGWVVVDVTIENQGGATATGFELVLIPHYGWGPPNPAGYEVLPSLAPGATHSMTFTPGVLYSDVGTFTLRVLVTDDWYATGNPDSTGSAGDLLVITNVMLDTSTPPVDGWVVVDVTIQNQGGAAADGFELVLIPHYGWGPPNPAGYEVLPSIAPGAARGVTFSPGVLYSDAGTFTLRVLVTDDWYELGNPDSTGSAGDYQDLPITVGGG